MSKNGRWLLILCLAQIFIMLVFINYSAILPLLKNEWSMNNTQAGSIFSVYQFGYIISGVILSSLTDRINTRNIFLISAAWSAIANLLFAIYAHDYLSGLILRGLTGIGMGGTYMPGLKLVAERFDSSERGRAVGIYVGALVLGSALSISVTGTITPFLGWRWAFAVCSAGVILGIFLSFSAFRGYKPIQHERRETGFRSEVLKNRPALLMILAYAAHMWEMYGMRSWLAPFFTASLIGWGMAAATATGWAANAAALIVGMGAISTAITGALSDRFGRTRTIIIIMTISVLFSFTFGWLINVRPIITLAVGIAYGYVVVADSPIFSAGLTELVAPAYTGAAMGLQSLIGYSCGIISPTVFGWFLDRFRGWQPLRGLEGDWGVGFASAGVVALAGPILMLLLRQYPASSRMAGGNK